MEHQTISRPRPFSCDICDKGFHTTYSLTEHTKKLHWKIKNHQCIFCSKEFYQVAHLHRHTQLHTGENPFFCAKCGYECPTNRDLNNHNVYKHSAEAKYKCELCPKKFKIFGALKNHLFTHTADKPYKCSICPRAFLRASVLRDHELTHSGQKPYKCPVCEASVSYKENLHRHMNVFHSLSKPEFSCSFCGKCFRERSSLKSHERVHTGEKPFQCKLCPKAFSVSNSLSRHIKTHLQERPYGCKTCKSSFMSSENLKIHMEIHSKTKLYYCNVCAMSFSTGAYYKSHVRLVHSNFPYKGSCIFCGKVFTSKVYLDHHYRKEVEEKIYWCRICGKECPWYVSFRKHALRYHGGNGILRK